MTERRISSLSASSMRISHRLRGFDVHDASRTGLRNALRQGISAFEVDIRGTKDGVPVLNHDPHLVEQYGDSRYIRAITLEHLRNIPHREDNESIMTLREMFEIVTAEKQKAATLCLDIKETGYEETIASLIDEFNLHENIVIVSWVPGVLFRMHKPVADGTALLQSSCNYVPLPDPHNSRAYSGGAYFRENSTCCFWKQEVVGCVYPVLLRQKRRNRKH